MRRLVIATLLGGWPAARAIAQPVWTQVTYISGAAVYVDAGTTLGVREGTRLDVVRGGAVVAVLVAQFVSSSRASCLVEHADSPPVTGDSVRFVAPPRATAGVADSATLTGRATPDRGPRYGGGRIRGRVGIRYLTLDHGNGGAGTIAQPGLDIRLDGQQIAGAPLGIEVDVRMQRTRYAGTSGDSARASAVSLSRVYQAVLRWNPPRSHTQVSVGRQFPAALSTIGMFDGTAVDFNLDRWSAGVLAGTDPEPVSMGLSPVTRRYGGYVQFHNAPTRFPLWTLTAGGAGAYDHGQIDREFAYLRATFTSARLSVFAAQEIDFNRGWKSAIERSSTTPTSTFVIAQVSIADGLTLNGGADNRRNVRLYRDYLDPESAFDDAFRQGAWGGASLTLRDHFRFSSDLRHTSGGASSDAQSVTHSASVVRLSPLQLGVHARYTAYHGAASTGSLRSGSVEAAPFSGVRMEWTLGRRESMHLGDAAPAGLTWTAIDADVSLGRAIYLMLSASRERGAGDRTSQAMVTLSYRF